MHVSGTVDKVHPREVPTRNGLVTFYNIKLDTLSDWIGVGTVAPSFQEGDQVKGTAEENKNGFLESRDLAVVAANARSSRSPRRKAGAAERPASPAPRQARTVSESTTNDRQQSIIYQHSQEMALRKLTFLASIDALPITKAASKANQAKRFDEVEAIEQKLVARYHRDAENPSRVLENVPDDGGISTAPDTELPFDDEPNGPSPNGGDWDGEDD